MQDTAALDARIKAQADELAALKADLAALAARPVADPSAEIATLKAGFEERLAESSAAADPAPAIAAAARDLQASIAALDTRLTEVEKRPAGAEGGVSATALAAYDRALQDLRNQIAAQGGQGSDVAAQIEATAADVRAQLAAARQEAEGLKAEATAAVQAATLAGALDRVQAAFDGGGPFAGALADLTASGIAVPPDLSALAEAGVPTLADLQRSFPAVARDALSAGLRAETPENWGDRITAFLRIQTGARSLEPREGTDPDAILSRAEASLNDGDIPATLAELATLPDAARQALALWVAEAEARRKATDALAVLAAAVAQ
jgi:hypothetical protein